uniref:Uncharacterized protein n=1 Tax=Timema cristinae TaxID=61476 RepID=A0A7R9CDF1_TIMCR|nr:unnamed protein product [Timema cristinae]
MGQMLSPFIKVTREGRARLSERPTSVGDIIPKVRLTATGCVLWFPLIPTPWLLTAASTPPSPLGEAPSEGDTPAAVVYSAGVTTSPSPSAGVGGGTMIMDGGLDALTPHHHHQSHPHHHHAFLLTENAAAAGHFNVLSFDTLYKEPPGGGGAASASPATPEPTPVGVEGEEAAQPGDLNTPVTTSGDIPSFFGPSTVVEPPPITVLLICGHTAKGVKLIRPDFLVTGNSGFEFLLRVFRGAYGDLDLGHPLVTPHCLVLGHRMSEGSGRVIDLQPVCEHRSRSRAEGQVASGELDLHRSAEKSSLDPLYSRVIRTLLAVPCLVLETLLVSNKT